MEIINERGDEKKREMATRLKEQKAEMAINHFESHFDPK